MITIAACFVANAPPLAALPVNPMAVFLILYAYTYEYTSHLYFPYILSYLFLIFLSPVTPEQLPKRLLGVVVGAFCIIAYQWVKGRNRIRQAARDVLLSIMGRAERCIDVLLSGEEVRREPAPLRAELCRLSKTVYDRRRRMLCISAAGFAGRKMWTPRFITAW